MRIILVFFILSLGLPGQGYARTQSNVVSQGTQQRVEVQQQNALDSRVNISQIGSYNNIFVLQTQRNNVVEARTDGADQQHRIEQHGYARNYVSLDSTGEANDSTIMQYGYYGTGNEAYVVQNGVSNSALIRQAGSNVLSLAQLGVNNLSTLAQHGAGNKMTLLQTGDDNSADLSQVGGGLELIVEQTGGAEVAIHQTQ